MNFFDKNYVGKTAYQILGVPRDASKSRVRQGYAELCKAFHPDIAQDSDNAFKVFTAAYNILKDRKTREKYDAFLKERAPGAHQEERHKPSASHDFDSAQRSTFSNVLRVEIMLDEAPHSLRILQSFLEGVFNDFGYTLPEELSQSIDAGYTLPLVRRGLEVVDREIDWDDYEEKIRRRSAVQIEAIVDTLQSKSVSLRKLHMAATYGVWSTYRDDIMLDFDPSSKTLTICACGPRSHYHCNKNNGRRVWEQHLT
jgi:curved DNA-binding protein CbpA